MERGAVGAPQPDPGPATSSHPPSWQLRGHIGFPVLNDLSGNRGFNLVYAFLVFLLYLFKIEEMRPPSRPNPNKPVCHRVSGQCKVCCADHSQVPMFPAGVDQWTSQHSLAHYLHSVRSRARKEG